MQKYYFQSESNPRKNVQFTIATVNIQQCDKRWGRKCDRWHVHRCSVRPRCQLSVIMKLKERLVMATLGFTSAIILLLVLDLSMVLPRHQLHQDQDQGGGHKVHGRVKTNSKGWVEIVYKSVSFCSRLWFPIINDMASNISLSETVGIRLSKVKAYLDVK